MRRENKRSIWTKMKAFVSIICVDGALFGYNYVNVISGNGMVGCA